MPDESFIPNLAESGARAAGACREIRQGDPGQIGDVGRQAHIGICGTPRNKRTGK